MRKTIHVLKLVPVVVVAALLFSCKQGKTTDGHEHNRADTIQHNEAANPYAPNDQSPMDMSYCPPDYPILKMNGTDTEALVARLIYSRPKKKGRQIFGSNPKTSLCEYGREWRLGANEATEIEFFRDVTIGGKKLAKGIYILYCIPYPDKWTIVFNNNLHTWGLHMDAAKDVFKTDVPVTQQSPSLEDFTMVFEKTADGANLVMAWDVLRVHLPINFSR